MNDLSDYLEPNDKLVFSEELLLEDYIGFSIFNNDIEESKIAIIGIPETRNSFPKVEKPELVQIRKYLFSLAEIGKVKITDLGNVKLGSQVKDTYASIEHITKALINKNIIPVFIGGSHDLTVPIISALNFEDPELVIFDSKFDIGPDDDFHSTSFIHKLNHTLKRKIIGSIAGYQSYFVSKQQQKLIDDLGFDCYRLGSVRNNYQLIEPVLRDADAISFDMSVIRSSDCPASTSQSPNGLYSEEACQLANLSGLSDKVKVFSLFDYRNDLDEDGQSAHLAAQIIWHFILGVSQRKSDYPNKSLDSYKKIFVKIDKMDTDLVFYQNPQNKRFWVEVPVEKSGKMKIASCSENDYKSTCMGEIPDRIWKKFSKSLK